MRARQPTTLFAFTVLVGLLRVVAYAGSPIGQELSVAALLHFVALHIVTFTFAAFLVASLSRATVTRAAFVALYAQAVLFLAPFVDVGLGLNVADYGRTYSGVFGGSPGSMFAVFAYSAIVAWGVHDATVGHRQARAFPAALAGIGALFGASIIATPWPRLALLDVPAWSLHLALAAYFSTLAAAFLVLAVYRGNPAWFHAARRHIAPIQGCGLAFLPLAGIVVAERLIVPQVPGEPGQRLLVEAPYVLAGVMSAAALWIQWRLVRSGGRGTLHLEIAAVAKVIALAFALPLGIAPFLATAAGASAAWLGRIPRSGVVLGVLASFAVLLGSLTVVAVDFAEVVVGPMTFVVPLNQYTGVTGEGWTVAVLVGALVALLSYLTSRTSASGRGRVSS